MTLDVECHRCGYAWNYTGSSDYYASCPQCKTSVPIDGGAPSGDSGGSGDRPTADAAETPSDDDLERLSARVEELETTASKLHGVIETMMSRVTELERRHTAVTTVQDGGGVEHAPSSNEQQPSQGSRPRDVSTGGATTGGRIEAQASGSAGPERGVRGGQRGGEPHDGDDLRTSSAEAPSDAGRRGGRNESGSSVSGRAANEGDGGPTVEPTPDEDGNYDYVCPSCDGPISGHPDVCIHCGTAFTW